MAETRERRPMSRSRRPRELRQDKVGGWYYVHVANRLDRVLLPLSRAASASAVRHPGWLLTTIGAKSGKERQTPLVYLPWGDKVCSSPPRPEPSKNPAWYTTSRPIPTSHFSQEGKRDYLCHEAEGSSG